MIDKVHISDALKSWWVDWMGGSPDEMEEILKAMSDDMVQTINENVTDSSPVSEVIFDILVDEGVLEGTDEDREDFIDFYEREVLP